MSSDPTLPLYFPTFQQWMGVQEVNHDELVALRTLMAEAIEGVKLSGFIDEYSTLERYAQETDPVRNYSAPRAVISVKVASRISLSAYFQLRHEMARMGWKLDATVARTLVQTAPHDDQYEYVSTLTIEPLLPR